MFKFNIYKDKVVITSAKRGSRLFTQEIPQPINQLNFLYKGETIASWSETFRKNLFNRLGYRKYTSNVIINFLNTKIYLLNRNPIGHISSGLWNWFEIQTSKDNFLGDYKDRFIYITATKESKDVNDTSIRLKDEISQLELLDILNLHIDWYNKNREGLIRDVMGNDGHLNTDQLKIQYLKNYLDVEVVDIEKVPNLLQHLGFDYDDTFNNYHRGRFSQKQSKLFYSMFLQYMLTQNPQCIIDGFKNIYGKCSVIRSSSLHKIDKDTTLINHIDKEVKLYYKTGTML